MTGKLRLIAMLGIALCTATSQGYAKAEPVDPRTLTFAEVNGEVITLGAYETALRVAGRQRFYHGKAPEADLVQFRRDVAERLIEERLFRQEAVRRGFRPDAAWVDAEFAKIERRYAASPQWAESAEVLQRQIREGLEDRSLIEQMDQALNQVDAPDDVAVRAYYEAHPDKFTSPEQFRVSTVLLRVDPWEPREAWEQRRAQAEEVLAALRGGADFAGYAERFPPADDAQMGYLHRGMLGATAQTAIDALAPGEISDTVTLLEGVAIFRLEERRPAQLNVFETVRQRAGDLLARELRESTYRERVAALRTGARVEYSDPDFAAGPRTTQTSGEATLPTKNE